MMRIVEETFIHNKKTINDPIELYSLLKELKLSIKKLKPERRLDASLCFVNMQDEAKEEN